MKRCLACLLAIILIRQCSIAAYAEEENGWLDDIWGWTKNTAEDVGNLVGSAADDAWTWAQSAAGDVATWTQGAAVDVGGWMSGTATNAAAWAKDAADDTWTWTTGVADDTWNWSKNAAQDVVQWTCETANTVWSVSSTAVSGTWNDIFGKVTGKGPHHLCVTSPLFKSTMLVGDELDENGIYTECFTYNDDYEIVLSATGRSEDILPPSVGEIDFSDLVASNFDSVTFAQDNAAGVGIRAMAQELRFKAVREGEPVFGRAIGIWTDHYIVAFIITSDIIIDENEEIVSDLPEMDALYDLWLETLSVYEVNKYDFETARLGNDGVNPGELRASSVLTEKRIFDEDKFRLMTGHGWAAENANTLSDNIRGIFNGQRAKVVGGDNVKNGPDRLIVDASGAKYLIQTKYYDSAKRSIDACFDSDGNFRYFDSNDKPMQVEVPNDQYKEALDVMKKHISEGHVKGIYNPEEAENIVRKGKVSHKQALNIARAGNIDSILYDAKNGCIECLSSFGISSVIEFAVGMWNGDDVEAALKQSVLTGLESGGTSFVVSVLSSQLSKSGLNKLMVGSTEGLFNKLGNKAASVYVKAMKGTNVYGAAAVKQAGKLLRGNVIVATVTTVVTSVPDVIDTFRGRISGKQLIKNVAVTAGGTVGGMMGGWWGGAAVVTMIFPGVGTVVGGIVGSVAGGYLLQLATDTVTDLFAEDDADEMLDIISAEFGNLAIDYLLSEDEATLVMEDMRTALTGNALKDMYASANRELFASEALIRPSIIKIIPERAEIELPDADQYQDALIETMEEMYDENPDEWKVE